MSWKVRKSADKPITTTFEGLTITLQPVTNDSRDRARELMGPMPPLGPVALQQARGVADEMEIELERVLQRLEATDPEAYSAAMKCLDWGQLLQRRLVAVSLIAVDGAGTPVPSTDAERVVFLDGIQHDDKPELNGELIAHCAVALGLSQLAPEGKEPSGPQSGSTEAA